MIEKFILSLFTKKENGKVITIVKEKRNIENIEIKKEKEKKPLNNVTSLSKYFVNIKSLCQSNCNFNLDRRKLDLQS